MPPLFERRHLRNAARLLAAPLVGRELGSPLRRAGALLVDLGLFTVLALPLMVTLTVCSAAVQVGGFDVLAALSEEHDGSPEALRARAEAQRALVALVAKRRPALVPEAVRRALEEGDDEALAAELKGLQVSLEASLGSRPAESSWDTESRSVSVTNDVLLGRWTGYLGGIAAFLAWFTLVLRLSNGRSPGKWLFGLRVVHASGRALGWRVALSRASALVGSFASFGFGFASAFWDGNRQAAHDKAADTFVIRWPRWGSPPASEP